MILGILLLIGGGALLVMALGRLRAARDPGGTGTGGLRLVIGPTPGQDGPRVTLRRGDSIAFGPVPADWDPPRAMGAVPAPIAGSGEYRVAAAVDLSAEDAFGTGDAQLAALLRSTVGPVALLLTPQGGERPVLLHGAPGGRAGSAAGIAMAPASLDALLAALGDPTGLPVQVVRRRVQRAGWGGSQGPRQRARQ